MTEERDNDAMLDMLIAARKAVGFTSGLSRQEFIEDEPMQHASIRLIQIVGEAARKVSTDRREQLPDIQWDQIIGMRHRLVHDYFHVNVDLVWQVLQAHLPELVTLLEAVVPPDEAS